MISFAIVSLIIGAILLAISSPRKGGDLKVGAKDVETTLPEITGPAKIPAFVLGLILIGIGLWMGITLFVKILDESDTQQAESGSQERSLVNVSPTVTPSATNIPQVVEISTFTPELPPTNIPASPTFVLPTPTNSALQPINTPILPTPTTGLTRQQINDRLGMGNWFCVPDRQDLLGVKKFPEDFVVSFPFWKIDTTIGGYGIGETVQGTSGTAWLSEQLPLTECPSKQQVALNEWIAKSSHPVTRELIDSVIGAGNWHCTGASWNVIVKNLSSGWVVQYPFTSADINGDKFGVGEKINSSSGTLNMVTMPKDECP